MSIRSNVDARGLDQRIEFQRRTPADDPQGGEIVTWPLLTKCWAKVDGMPAKEAARGDQMISVGAYTFWIRADVVKRHGVKQTDRILWNDRIFNILDMPDQQLRGRLAAVIANTGQNDG